MLQYDTNSMSQWQIYFISVDMVCGFDSKLNGSDVMNEPFPAGPCCRRCVRVFFLSLSLSLSVLDRYEQLQKNHL